MRTAICPACCTERHDDCNLAVWINRSPADCECAHYGHAGQAA